MSMIKFEKEILRLIKNRKKIPDDFWIKTEGQKYEVIWFMNRQKPSVEASYDFDEERLGLTKKGEIIWGFDSGCSCASPWSNSDYGDDSYNTEKTWKEFKLKSEKETASDLGKEKYDLNWFDKGWEDECYSNMKDYLLLIKDKLEPLEVLEASNAEVRRYLMKRVGYDKIRNNVEVNVLLTEGTSELLKIKKDKYVKVKDSSTNREYLLYVPDNIENIKQGIAWTFNLSEDEYNPIKET